MTLSHDDSPVERELAADIIIFYGIDEGTTYEIISNKTRAEMGSRRFLQEVEAGQKNAKIQP